MRTLTVWYLAACLGGGVTGCKDEARSASRSVKGTHDSPGLHWAALMGDEALSRRLLAAGADKDELDSHGRATPLGVAADAGNISIVRLLLDAGADVNKASPLYYAAQKGHLEIVELLLRAGADPNRYLIGSVPSPLLAAAREGHLSVMKLLVDHKCNMDIDDRENSPLLEAAAYGHADVVEYLVAKGHHVDVAAPDGRTPLYIAAANGDLDVVRVLLKYGADSDHKDQAGRTPRLVAEEKGQRAILEAMETMKSK